MSKDEADDVLSGIIVRDLDRPEGIAQATGDVFAGQSEVLMSPLDFDAFRATRRDEGRRAGLVSRMEFVQQKRRI